MTLDTLFARVFQSAVSRSLEAWRVGRLTVHFPDGTSRTFGPPRETLHATVWIEDPAAIRRFVLGGDLGAGESYLDGQWRADDLARFATLVLLNQQALALDTGVSKLLNLGNDLRHLLRRNTRRGSRRNIRDHYDLSNELFALFLDETMTYSCALFESEDQPLAEAQLNKYRTIAEKARLRPGDHVLEIGCGWGGFALFAARTYGCRVTGVTISEEQQELARRRVAEAGLESRIEIHLQDYRDLEGRFDKIVSIEMFEALGLENWTAFFRKCTDVLAPEGLMVLQTISVPDHRFAAYARHADWIQKYIFPGSLLASVHHMTGALIRAGALGVHHLEDIGIHYAPTLARWRQAFRARLPEVRRLGFDDRFIRMWEYYLCICEASFATRTLGNLQVVLTRPGNASLPGVPQRRSVAA